MTTMIIVVGILGTVFLSFAAYKHWSDVAPTPRLKPIGIVGNRKFRIKWRWSWFWWAIGIGYVVIAYHYYPWEQSDLESEFRKSDCFQEVPDDTPDVFMTIVHLGCPAKVKMKPKQMIVWWGDKSKFTSYAVWQKSDKFRVFEARGVNNVTIKIHRYHDPDPLWYTRQ
ncbi:MAG: hypothetical protein A2544_01375 [Candidatus Zambryskibacteria bacterium RIFOXYD2_FULL_43_10]|uniref:Uncharacterized protein n=1 Tax=Candidatus Zambryskibacteria bacterium RIFOXYD2_FULL_43_10 TaxID=1802782 RepID=A0A1G2V8C7_9BACT|nr:MAG: hypothetical protein A2544_01375 [Candidatus Zambryskibacteria bacterium RIFOXYD2_FULL_43_10]